MGREAVIYEQIGRVGLVTVDRPEKRNALNRAVRLELADILGRLERDESVSALIVTGAGDKAFIAGADLNELKALSPLEFLEFADSLGQRLYNRLEELDIPVIAMINGLCLGGGLELALACDVRLASDTAKLGQPEILLGIMPGSGATQRLPRLIGQGRARELVFGGEVITAQEAERMGLVNRVLPADRLREATLDLAQKMAEKSRVSLKMIKRSFRMSQEAGLSSGLAFEALAMAACFTSPDKDEGISAFLEKRPPKFGWDKNQ